MINENLNTNLDYVTITNSGEKTNSKKTKINQETKILFDENLLDEVITNIRYQEFDQECNDIVNTLNNNHGEIQLTHLS